ncbi:MAG: HDOD domain-containing protein [Halieaceae bacterium]|nr:HDOD domain-containing protein [Halieaceae bacterium]
MNTPQILVDSVLHLVSLPDVYLRLQETIEDPSHSREQLAEIIAYDPALSARVLRVANSSYYSFPREIETVSSAVGLIGEIELRNMVLATIVIGAMTALDYSGIDIEEFWSHSLRCGITARLLARLKRGHDPEILFLAGVLHDLGILVIYQREAALAGAVTRQINEQHQLRDQAEREILGFDHAEVGALLARAWDLSDALSELIRCHHQYQLARGDQEAAMILALANQLTNAKTEAVEMSDISLTNLMEKLEIDESALAEVVEASEQQYEEIRSIIFEGP